MEQSLGAPSHGQQADLSRHLILVGTIVAFQTRRVAVGLRIRAIAFNLYTLDKHDTRASAVYHHPDLLRHVS